MCCLKSDGLRFVNMFCANKFAILCSVDLLYEDGGSTVVKVLCYKSERDVIGIFHLHNPSHLVRIIRKRKRRHSILCLLSCFVETI